MALWITEAKNHITLRLAKAWGKPCFPSENPSFGAKKNLQQLAAGFCKTGLEILKKLQGEKSELMM
jgi:hypothetical protein